MIYTVTFNPSLDYIVSVDDFKLGLTNRTSSELMLPGGKGINVSIVLKNLGIQSTALGFMAGFTGKEIARRLEEEGVALLTWRATANNLYTNWLNYYVYQATPYDLEGTPDFTWK